MASSFADHWIRHPMNYNVLVAGIVFIALLLLTWPIARRASRVDDDPRIAMILMLALALKLIAALARYWVAFYLYDGSADAGVYLRHGEQYSASMREGDFSFDYRDRGGGDGTIFVRHLTGWVMFITGPSRFAAVFVFSWFSFIGLMCFYRASAGHSRPYAMNEGPAGWFDASPCRATPEGHTSISRKVTHISA